MSDTLYVIVYRISCLMAELVRARMESGKELIKMQWPYSHWHTRNCEGQEITYIETESAGNGKVPCSMLAVGV